MTLLDCLLTNLNADSRFGKFWFTHLPFLVGMFSRHLSTPNGIDLTVGCWGIADYVITYDAALQLSM